MKRETSGIINRYCCKLVIVTIYFNFIWYPLQQQFHTSQDGHSAKHVFGTLCAWEHILNNEIRQRNWTIRSWPGYSNWWMHTTLSLFWPSARWNLEDNVYNTVNIQFFFARYSQHIQHILVYVKIQYVGIVGYCSGMIDGSSICTLWQYLRRIQLRPLSLCWLRRSQSKIPVYSLGWAGRAFDNEDNVSFEFFQCGHNVSNIIVERQEVVF